RAERVQGVEPEAVVDVEEARHGHAEAPGGGRGAAAFRHRQPRGGAPDGAERGTATRADRREAAIGGVRRRRERGRAARRPAEAAPEDGAPSRDVRVGRLHEAILAATDGRRGSCTAAKGSEYGRNDRETLAHVRRKRHGTRAAARIVPPALRGRAT